MQTNEKPVVNHTLSYGHLLKYFIVNGNSILTLKSYFYLTRFIFCLKVASQLDSHCYHT